VRDAGVDLAGAEARNEAAPGWSDVGILFAETKRLRTELERAEGDLAVAVREATTARAVADDVLEQLHGRAVMAVQLGQARYVLAAVEAALAGNEQAVWKVATAQQLIIDAYHVVAAPVQPEETQQ